MPVFRIKGGNQSISPDTIRWSQFLLDQRPLLSSPHLDVWVTSRPRVVITSPSVEMLFAKTSPAAWIPSAAQVQLPGHFSVILWQLHLVDSSSFFFFFSPGSILQAQLAFIFVEGTKWICHHSSHRQRRKWLVNAIIYKILKSPRTHMPLISRFWLQESRTYFISTQLLGAYLWETLL